MARLLDLSTLDSTSLNFPSSKLAAAALSFLTSISFACHVSGYTLEDLRECHEWMTPLAIGVQEMGPAPIKSFSQIPADDVHNIQTHAVTLDTLVRIFFFKYFNGVLSDRSGNYLITSLIVLSE